MKGLNAVVPFVQVVDKFGQRWRALKPQEMKDWSMTEVDRVFAALTQWREMFQEHKDKVRGWGKGDSLPAMGFQGWRRFYERDMSFILVRYGVFT